MRRNGARTSVQAQEVARVLFAENVNALRSAEVERIAAGHASRLYGLREYWFGRHRFPLELTGADHLDRALQGGRGAILWIGRFVFASLFSKVALYERGFRVSHLSRPTHGFGTSAFAVRRLNPIWTRIEERFLHERIVLRPGTETAVLRTLRRRLASNEILSISVGDEGLQTMTVPLLAGELRVATGPVSLALASGAPLLPVFTVRDRVRAFTVTVQAPLVVPPADAPRKRVTSVVQQYAERLAPLVREYPGQWLGSGGPRAIDPATDRSAPIARGKSESTPPSRTRP